MPYTKQTWEDLPSVATPVTATRLRKLETQYEEAVADAKLYVDGKLDATLSGPIAVALAESKEARDLSKSYRDEAETFAAGTVALQDAAIAQAIDTPGSATQMQLNATFGGIIPTFPTITEAEVALGNGGLTVGQKFFITGASS